MTKKDDVDKKSVDKKALPKVNRLISRDLGKSKNKHLHKLKSKLFLNKIIYWLIYIITK